MIHRRKNRGLTLVEAILLLVIISIVAVAAGVGLQAVAKVPETAETTMGVNEVLVTVVEQTKANLQRNWPSSNWGGTNYAFLINGTSYTPTASTAFGTYYATPTSGSTPAPVVINDRTYQIKLTMATTDPGIGSAQSDFMQVTVQAYAVINGSVSSSAAQTMVTYVAKP